MRQEFQFLSPPEAAFAAAVAAPRRMAFMGIAALIALGWVYLLAMTTASGVTGTFAALGPGMDLFDKLASSIGLDRVAFPLAASSGLLHALAAICATDPASWGAVEAGLHLGMWLAMALAMMLPSAAPMLRTYSEIADTAAAKGEPIVSPLMLAAGYLAAWAAFAVAATGLHWLLGVAGLISGVSAPVGAGLAAVLFAAAGIYQFLPLKAACLTKCADPFPYLFANWTERPAGVFRLGAAQGAFCVGCCWAMMLAMFAVGVMNLLWIALLAAIITAEKSVGRIWFTRAIGAGSLACAAGFAAGIVFA